MPQELHKTRFTGTKCLKLLHMTLMVSYVQSDTAQRFVLQIVYPNAMVYL